MSFYVRSKTGYTWQVWETFYKDGKRGQRKILTESYSSLGFNPSMSLAEARDRAKELNLKKQTDKRLVPASRRARDITIVESIYVPKGYSDEFYKRLIQESFSKNDKKILSHWQYLQTMLKDLHIEAVEYNDRQNAFYKYFVKNGNSYDYVRKLIRLLNMWGKFICKKRGQSFYPVDLPSAHVKNQIHEAYQTSGKYRGPSDPLTPILLKDAKSKLKVQGNYEWLFVSLWFGLRPSEINVKNFLIKHEEGKQVLCIYQPKLTAIEERKRWKSIPVLYSEQEEALGYLKKGLFKKPLNKTMHTVFGGKITLYGGRKGFVDLMLDRKQKLEDISSWMGHSNIQRTWESYRNRQRVGGT
jgi:hypothetical protein